MKQVIPYQAVHDLVSQVAKKFSGSPAIEYGHRRITYGELDAKAERLSGALSSLGVSAGSIVGVFTTDPIEIIAAILGTLKAGAVFCPFDPSFPEKRLEVMIESVTPRWFVTESRFYGKLKKLTAGMSSSPDLILMDEEPADARNNGAIRLCDDKFHCDPRTSTSYSDPEAACSIYFTSGSTGKPKAILGRLKGIDHFVRWEIETLGVGPGTRVSQLASPSFDGFLKDAFVPLCAGGVVCAPESREVILSAGRLRDWLDIEQVEVLHCVPSVFRSLINEGLESKYFDAMKYAVMAGEALLPTDVKRWMEVFGDRIKLVNLYGPTETTILKFFHFVRPEEIARPSIPIGKPIKGAAALILDQQNQPCDVGDVGEIHIRTPYCALGYYGEPELTREVFIQNPFNDDPADIVYKTGDYGRLLEDGSIEFLGRRDQQVKVRGVRVELGEIENALRGHHAVADVAVIDSVDSDGNKFLVAYVTLSNRTGGDQLRPYLAERLPEAMLPSAFVEMAQLPRTLNGKIDRKALPPLELAQAGSEVGESAPRTPIEEIVSGVWSEVLKLPSVSRASNFFNLGGHSLLVTQVISRVREALNVELPMRSLFESPTVEQFSRLIQEQIDEGRLSEQTPIKALPRESQGDLRAPLSFAQQRLWFIDQLDPGNAAYNCPEAVRLEGRLNLQALESVINEILRRHEVLRTRFEVEECEPVQVIEEWAPRQLEIEDLTSLGLEEREERVRRIARQESETGFDLSRGPLLRVKVLKLEEEEHVLLFTLHHIACDAWSMEILIREVGALYGAYSAGESSPLEKLPVQYADFAVWQRERLQDEALERDLEYWRKQLAEVEALKLPTDHPRPATPSYRGAQQTFALETELAEALRKLSKQEGVTLFMTLLAAFQTLLYRYTGQEDLIVGTPIANRGRLELEGLIGFFVNTLALRSRLSSDISFRDLLHQVRKTALAAYSHDHVPFEKLVEELSPERSAGENPLFQAWFFLDDKDVNDEPILPGITLSPVKVDFFSAKLDLALTMTASPNNIAGAFTYATDLFENKTIVTLIERFRFLLQSLVRNPDCKLLDLPLAVLSGKRQLAETYIIDSTDETQATFVF